MSIMWGGDVGPQTKTITVQNSSTCDVQLNEQIIEGSNTEDVVLELGKTYDLYIPNGNPNVLQDFVDCNVDTVSIEPINLLGQNGITVYINGNPTDTFITIN